MRNCVGSNAGRVGESALAISCYPMTSSARVPDPLCERSPTSRDPTLCPPWQAPGRLCSSSNTSAAADIDSAVAAGMGGKSAYRKRAQRGSQAKSSHSATQFDAWHGDLSNRLENALSKLSPMSGRPGANC